MGIVFRDANRRWVDEKLEESVLEMFLRFDDTKYFLDNLIVKIISFIFL